MKTKVYSVLNQAIYIIFFILGILILAINFFSNINYTCKTNFLLPNIVLFPLGVCAIAMLQVIWGKVINCFKQININHATIVLFLCQCYIFTNITFISQQWDAWVVFKYAQMFKDGLTDSVADAYFSTYTCNQLIVAIYTFVLKINDVIGLGAEKGLYSVILMQCILSAYTGKLLFQIVLEYTKFHKFAWLGWSIYVILIGLSGWNVVTYTDIMGLIFPIAILRLYQLLSNKKSIYLKWFGIITLSFWGIKMKATVVVIVIAIIIVEVLECVREVNRQKLKTAAMILGISLLSILLYTSIFHCIVRQTGLNIDPEADVGALHVVMIGLNSAKDGAWYGPDEELSKSIPFKEERREAQLEVIRQRLEAYRVGGFLEHMWRKSLVIFNDGTFAWGHEGGFFDLVYDNKNEVIAPFLKSLYYTYGSRYGILSTVCQMFWITVLVFSVGVAFGRKEDKLITTLVLSLIGIILFTYLTEARARYLILYVPFFIIAAIITWFRLLENKKSKRY